MAENPIVGGSSPTDNICAPIDSPYLLASADSRLTAAVTFPGVIIAGSSAPADTRYLWLNTSSTPSVLEYFNGSIWQPFAAVGPAGPAGPGPWSLMTADFTAGAAGAGGLSANLAQTAGFAVGAYVTASDLTGAQACYCVTASPLLAGPSSLTLTRMPATSSLAAGYVFTVGNAALITLGAIVSAGSAASACEPVAAPGVDGPEIVFAAGDVVTSATA